MIRLKCIDLVTAAAAAAAGTAINRPTFIGHR